MSHSGINNHRNLQVDTIYRVQYFKNSNNFSYENESLDFWKFIYVDSGTVKIAIELGYSSIHYFSRHFKHFSGISPTEYAKSVEPSPEAE